MQTTLVSLKEVKESQGWDSALFVDALEIQPGAPYSRMRLRELTRETTRGWTHRRHSFSQLPEIPLLSRRDLTNISLLPGSSTQFLLSDEHSISRQGVAMNGDLLVALVIASEKRIAAVYKGREPAVLSADLAVLRLRESLLDPYYLAAFLNSSVGRQMITRQVANNARHSVSISRLLEIAIPVPPLDEQKRVSAAVEEKLIQAAIRKREAEELVHQADEIMAGFA